MFFNLEQIGKGKEFALKFIDSLPLKQLELIRQVFEELLEFIHTKIKEKENGIKI